MEPEAVLKMTVEIPRSTILALGKRFKGEGPQIVAQAIESAAGPDDDAVRVSKDTIMKVCSLLGVGAINSERALIEAIQARFKVGAGSVMLQLDPNVTQAMEGVARANGVPLSDVVKNYFQAAIANGWFETTWDLYSLLFSPQQWKQLKAAFGKLPADASTVVRVLSDWAQMKQAMVEPPERETAGAEIPTF